MRPVPVDPATAAIPFYFASMEAERRWLHRHAAERGPTPADYERRDTIASLTMGTASLVAPIVLTKLLAPIVPGKGKYGKVLVGTALGAAALTTAADFVARLDGDTTTDTTAPEGSPGSGATAPVTDVRTSTTRERRRRAVGRVARKVAAVGGVATVVTAGTAITTAIQARVSPKAMWNHRVVADLGTGALPLAAAIAGWDFIYYWNHRWMHTSRYMWAIHVVHHSSEHYNLSTALRQPVADAFGTFVPYSLVCLFGVRPELLQTARGLNLVYQYWIHTDAIKRLGPAEEVFNTASHHRVHHGSNTRYIDRNHGSILILWDRLFGTFTREDDAEPVVYGLTTNIDTFNPAQIATHEHVSMLRDVAESTSWSDRLQFVVRGPGWAYARHRERAAAVA